MLELTLRDSEDDRAELRAVALGVQPIVLIEPFLDEGASGDEDEDYGIRVDATGMVDRATLADLLEVVATALRRGEVVDE